MGINFVHTGIALVVVFILAGAVKLARRNKR
jgi:hypothetical protein